MSRRLMVLGGVALVIVILGVALVVPTLAQDPAPKPGVGFGCGGRGFGLWGGDWSLFDTTAEVLGLTPEELFGELHGGKTLADVAGDDLEKVQEAMQAARAEGMQEAIQQAVEDGRITQERAEWMLKGQELGFMHGRRGISRGMRDDAGSFAPSRLPFSASSSSS